MDEIQRALLQEMVRFVPWTAETYDPGTKLIRTHTPGTRCQWVMYALAYLYKSPMEGNPWHGDRAILERAIGLGDGMLAHVHGDGLLHDTDGTVETEEWPPYFLSGTAELLGNDLPAASRARWTAFARAYCEYMLKRPFFFTSPNHEAWRCAAIVRVAQTFGWPDFADRALFLVRAQADYQTPEGFWEEGRHHSVSTTYNYVMLSPLYALWKMTGDEVVRGMAVKLLNFMTAWAHPDGSTAGCLDGRQAWSAGDVGSGLDLTPHGRRLRRLTMEMGQRLGSNDPQGGLYSNTNWNAHARVVFACDTLRRYESGAEEPLACERDGFLAEQHSGTFDAALHRRGPWNAVASGIVSDIPVGAPSVFRLSRENRLDLWHARAGLVLGGGNSPAPAEVQHALVHVVTGFHADCDFGRVDGELKLRQAMYFPRAARAFAAPGRLGVRLTYAHARVIVTAHLDQDDRARVTFETETSGVRKLYLQLPFVAMHGALVKVDGNPLGGASSAAPEAVEVREKVEITEQVYGALKVFRPPQGLRARVRFPIQPLRTYGSLEPNERYGDPFNVGLLSVEVPEPKGKQTFSFDIEIHGP